MPDEIETVTVDEATTDYYIASVAVVPAPDPDSYTAGWREPWPAADKWHLLAAPSDDTFTTSLDEITRGGPAFTIDRRAGVIELTDPPLRRTPPRPRTWPRGKWFALSRRRRKSPPIVW